MSDWVRACVRGALTRREDGAPFFVGFLNGVAHGGAGGGGEERAEEGDRGHGISESVGEAR